VLLCHKTASTSDHCPILLQLEVRDRVQIQKANFRYELLWESHEDFRQDLGDQWIGISEARTVESRLEHFRDVLSIYQMTCDLRDRGRETRERDTCA
jgi:hypothetical protein